MQDFNLEHFLLFRCIIGSLAVPPFLQNCQQCKDHCGFTTAPSVAGRYCILTAQLLKIPSCLGQHSIYKCPITEATVGHAHCTMHIFPSVLLVTNSRGLCHEMDESGWNGWKWMYVDESGWNRCKWMKMDGCRWKWMKSKHLKGQSEPRVRPSVTF